MSVLDVNSIVISESNIFIGTRNIGLWKRLISEVIILTVSTNSISIDATDNSKATFNLTSNTNWAVSSSETWLTVSNTSGSGDAKITVTAQKNPTINTRNAIVIVSATGLPDKTVKVTQVGSSNGIDEIIEIYPNPAKDYLIINSYNYSEMPDYSIKIVNIVGITAFKGKVSQAQYEINLFSWSGKGVYFMQVYDSNNKLKAVKKIILQ